MPVLRFLAVAIVATSLHAQVTLKLEPYRKNVALRANVGGHDGVFVFDTGAGVTLVTPKFAEKIGCKPWGRVTGFTMMGKRIDSPRCGDLAVKIQGHTFEARDVTLFDIMSVYPPDAVPIDGLIALNIFAKDAITIDFPAKTLTFETPSSLKQRAKHAVELPMRIAREAQGRALAVSAGVRTPSGMVWFEIDSGNGGTILVSKPYASFFGIDPDKQGPQPAKFPIGGGLVVTTQDAFAPDMIIDGNIGMPFLKDVAVTMDLKGERLWITPGASSSQVPVR